MKKQRNVGLNVSALISSFTCGWCDEAPLVIRHRMESQPNGAGSTTLQGYYIGCTEIANGCPDTTGCFPTEAEALDYFLQERGEPTLKKTLQEASYLVSISIDEMGCPNWVEGVGDCGKCPECRKGKCVERLDRYADCL